MISLVPLSAVDQVWPEISHWVDRACKKARSNRTAPDVYAMCRNGACWLALALEGGEIVGCSVMQIYDVEGKRVLQHVIVAGEGDTDAWFVDLINWDWITGMGVQRVVCEGRPGWSRRLKPIIPSLNIIRVQFEWEHSPQAQIVIHDEAERAARGYDA